MGILDHYELTFEKAYEVENRKHKVGYDKEHFSEAGGVFTDTLTMHLQELFLISATTGTLRSRYSHSSAVMAILLDLVHFANDLFNFHVQARQIIGKRREDANQNKSRQVQQQVDQNIQWGIVWSVIVQVRVLKSH